MASCAASVESARPLCNWRNVTSQLPVANGQRLRHSARAGLSRKTSQALQKQNRMTTELTFTGFAARLRGIIVSQPPPDEELRPVSDETFANVALALFGLQFQH